MTRPEIREAVTITGPFAASKGKMWRVKADGKTVARLYPADGGRWRIQKVGHALMTETFVTSDEAIEAAGYRPWGTPTEEAARKLNLAAKFYPGSDEGLPCIEVAGVQVYVYIDRLGRLRVSIDTETSELPVRDDGTTPMLICVMEGVVYDDTGEESLPCEDDRLSIPDTYEFTRQFVDRFIAPTEHPHDYGDYSDVQ